MTDYEVWSWDLQQYGYDKNKERCRLNKAKCQLCIAVLNAVCEVVDDLDHGYLGPDNKKTLFYLYRQAHGTWCPPPLPLEHTYLNGPHELLGSNLWEGRG